MKISYGITACTEENTIPLIKLLLETKREDDEIVVLLDNTNTPEDLLKSLRELQGERLIILEESSFTGNFGEWKNKLNSLCIGDYILQLDADETVNPWLIDILHTLLENNPDCDLYFIPRINIVEGITEEDIQKWGWKVNERNHINFPDYQGRLYRNFSNIKWEGKVHERIVGHAKYSILPSLDEYCLVHIKGIDRQRSQNQLYDTLVK